jgi:predicted glycosyltransferase
LIVIRPPAPWTAYHRFENELFNQLLAFLNRYTEPYLLFVSRIPNQNDGVQQLENVHFAEKVYDGPQLLYHADAVISGGGTMNREAAVLGTPTYTIFGGRMGAVDKQLINTGKMTWINSIDDFRKVRLSQKKNGNTFHADMNLVQDVVNLFVS